MSRHTWTEIDDDRLCKAVSLLEQPDAVHKRTALWQAVCGILATHGIVVSPSAASSRYYRLTHVPITQPEPDGETPDAPDAWERVSAMVDEYEADALDTILRTLVVLESEVSLLRADVALLRGMWE